MHTAETKEKISNSKKIIGNGHTGKRYVNNGTECYCVNQEDIAIWLANGFRLGRLTSKQGHINMSKKIFCVELNKYFNSITEAAEELGLKISKISLCCNGKRHTTGGLHFKFINGPKKRG